jgi:site-specific DNA-methyltransferase (adenine-specific)
MNKIAPNFLDQILCCDCVEGMRSLPDGCIDLTVTSPPYDGLRDFGGYEFTEEVFRGIAQELWRATCPGGVVTWVVADQINGGYSGTSFRQALYFMEIGFRLHDIIIMTRMGDLYVGPRYGKIEFAFVLSKGTPRSINLIRNKPNKHAGKKSRFRSTLRDGSRRVSQFAKPIAEMGLKGPIWNYSAGYLTTTPDRYVLSEHPAVMPDEMAKDLITSWSRPGDLVLDPMMGSATTCKMALLNQRHYLGFEIHEPYFDLAERRMREHHAKYRDDLDAWLIGA